MALGAIAIRELLDRKYALQAQENAIRQQQVTSQGLVNTAQVGLIGTQAAQNTVQTGLLPGTAAAENAFTQARTSNLAEETRFLAPRYNAEIGFTNARTRTEGAQQNYLGMQSKNIGAQTTGITQDNTSAADIYGIRRRQPVGLRPLSSLGTMSW